VAEHIDVSIEHRNLPEPATDEKPHPNTCPKCGSHYRDDELAENLRVCPQCNHHFSVRARERILQLADEGTFREEAAGLRSQDPLEFFDQRPYPERLAEAEVSTGLGDAMVIGSAAIVSLMQLPKTICAVEDLKDAGGAMISVMAHPTTAGVLASFASLGDVMVAEPGALLAFTGPRVVQQTTREKLPEDFGLAEQNVRFGHLDGIVGRHDLRPYLGRVLRLFDRNHNGQ
jgi:acetyl-CoA carboxylase carboxyl transferase subunit beta